MRTYFTLAIFIVFAVGSYWLLQNTNKEITEDKKSAERFPDYFMENFSITSMNIQGQPESILKAKKMLHYADDDSAELDQPSLRFNRGKSQVTLTADRAKFFKQKNILYLYDNVIIHRQASASQSELFIYTNDLKINTETNIAETEQAATIKMPQTEINSVGLIFDNIRGTLTLPSKVKGVYETPQ